MEAGRKTAFVTGSTGLLGNNLVRSLVAEGWEVRALARSREKARRLLGDLPGVEVVEGDMLDVAGFAGSLGGSDVLFHAAAYFREYYQRADSGALLEKINVRATVELLREAHGRGVKKTVFVSSGGTVGTKPDGSPGDEATPPDASVHDNGYFMSKVRAEEAIRGFVRESGADVVTVLPGWMFGPYDAAPTGSGQLVLDFLQKKVPIVLEGGTSVSDARDVARAMVSTAERGKAGERYVAAGNFATVAEILGTLEKVSGVPGPGRRVPYPLLMTAAGVAELVGRATGRPPLISRGAIRTMRHGGGLDSGKARRELGATFRPLAETLGDEVAWYRQQNEETPIG